MSVRFDLKASLSYIIILSAAVVFASFYGGVLPFTLLFGIMLFIPVSVICIAVNYHCVLVYQGLSSYRVIKGERHDLKMSFENTGFIPIHNMELLLHSDRCRFEGIEDGERISIDQRSKTEINARVECIYGGTYNIGIKSLGFSDIFGMFTVRLNVPYSFRAIVSPKITDIAETHMDIENLINSVGSKSEIRMEEIPGNDMRSYRPGDPMSRINWKVSARNNELMVRVPDKQDTRRITLILEPANVPERDQDIRFLIRRDYFLEFAVSSAWYFARRGLPVLMIYPAGRITQRQVDSYDSFREFYNDVSGGNVYRSDDEKDRMHKLTQERRQAGYGNETAVLILEDEWPGEDFCIVAG